MGKKVKKLSIPKEFAQKVHDDFEGKNLKVRIFSYIPQEYIDFGLVHVEVAEKSAGLMVAISGSAAENRDYMVFSPLRIDQSDDYYVTDMDPTVMVYNNEDNKPGSSGVVCFHGKFEGRTEPTGFTISHSIQEIQKSLSYKEFDFECAPDRYQKATHHMAYIFKKISDE
jgi:hypothetical protein